MPNLAATLTVPRLRVWLESLPADAVCGVAQEPCDCPVARYLRIQGEPYVFVAGHQVELGWRPDDNPTREYWAPVPLALRPFIAAVDALGEDVAVTAAQALRLLGAVP